jgi:hypothetical protein
MRAAIALLALALSGCATTQGVRYVYQDGQFGVVGIPENTDRWPTRYRTRAEELMAAHFPEGHEVVRAEEVVEGTRTLTIQGSNTAEVAPVLPAELLRIGKLGLSASRSQADQVKVKECRIIYRKALRPALEGFSEVASLTPPEYVDPNAAERRKTDGGVEVCQATQKAPQPGTPNEPGTQAAR